jgi:hypothetical protein
MRLKLVRHSSERWNPLSASKEQSEIPAFAGMTMQGS